MYIFVFFGGGWVRWFFWFKILFQKLTMKSDVWDSWIKIWSFPTSIVKFDLKKITVYHFLKLIFVHSILGIPTLPRAQGQICWTQPPISSRPSFQHGNARCGESLCTTSSSWSRISFWDVRLWEHSGLISSTVYAAFQGESWSTWLSHVELSHVESPHCS